MEINFLVALVHGFPPPEYGFPRSRKMARERPTHLSCLLSPTTTKGSAFQEVLRLVELHHTTEESHRATAEVATNPQFEQADVNKCRNKWV